MGQLDKNDIMAGPLGQRPDSCVWHVCVQTLWLWLRWRRWPDCTFSGQFCGEVDVFFPYSGEPTAVYLASYFLAAAAACALTCCLWLPDTLSVAVSDQPQQSGGLGYYLCVQRKKKKSSGFRFASSQY